MNSSLPLRLSEQDERELAAQPLDVSRIIDAVLTGRLKLIYRRAKSIIKEHLINPANWVVGSAQDFFRRSDGAGICVCGEGPEQTMSLAVVLENGEFWAADRFMAEEDPVDVRIFPESQYFELMEKCISVYRKSLQLDLPWVWEAGVEGLENKRLLPWTPRNAFSAKPTGVSLKDVVVKRGEIHSADARPQDVLRPFVEAFYDAFHSKPQGAVFD